MPSNESAQHKASVDEMLALISDSLKALPPQQPLAKKDAVLLRWVMTLGALMLNVGRSISRLIETGDVVSITILARCTYEYRTKARFFLKDATTRRLAFDQYMTTVTAYTEALKRLPTLTPILNQQLDAAQEAWIKAGGKADKFSGKRGVTAMATELAPKEEILTDEDGNKYTYELRTFYNTPSWYVHAEAPLIAEFFSTWQPDSDDPADFVISETPLYHDDVCHIVRGCIGDMYMYLGTVRTYYKIPMDDVQAAVGRAKLLSPLHPNNAMRTEQNEGNG
jgi:hypothetical protein